MLPSNHRTSNHRSSSFRILGIDPGLQRTGWGVVSAEGNRLTFIAGGVIATKTESALPHRLHALNEGLSAVVGRFQPASAAVEETFVNKNGASTLKLGQARGAILLTLSLHNLQVAEYSANLVKKSVTGSGHGEKEQVARMVQMLLPGCRELPPDAMDALAVAICHAHHGCRLMVDS
jgi:crossover junction endodeoxyribonuclease RuvC